MINEVFKKLELNEQLYRLNPAKLIRIKISLILRVFIVQLAIWICFDTGVTLAQPVSMCNAPFGDGTNATPVKCSPLSEKSKSTCPLPDAPIEPGTVGSREACLATCTSKLNACLTTCSPLIPGAEECLRGVWIRFNECMGRAKSMREQSQCHASWVTDYAACMLDTNGNAACHASCYLGALACAIACNDPTGCLRALPGIVKDLGGLLK